MSITVVVNGYYRSGTTFIWEVLRDALPKHRCFYEPLHSYLPGSIAVEKDQKNFLHGVSLWKEYLDLPEDVRNSLFRNHPNAGQHGFFGDAELFAYLDVYNGMKSPVLLQTNRMHFFLGPVAKRYKPKMVHIVRHPLDVLLSMKRAHQKESNVGKRIVRGALAPIVVQRADGFGIDKEFLWIMEHVGLPVFGRWKAKYFHRLDLAGKLIVVWTMSNYHAIKAIEKNKGHLVVYEAFLSHPKKEWARLSKFFGIKSKSVPKVKEGNFFKFKKKDLAMLERRVKTYGVEKEFAYVVNAVKIHGIDYRNPTL